MPLLKSRLSASMEQTQNSSGFRPPDFYLTASGECELLSDLRACRVVRRLRTQYRDDCMLVEISPPLIGQTFGLGDKDITLLLLSPRHAGTTLFPISEWPFYVYVARLVKNQAPAGDSVDANDLEVIAWARLYPDPNQAK